MGIQRVQCKETCEMSSCEAETRNPLVAHACVLNFLDGECQATSRLSSPQLAPHSHRTFASVVQTLLGGVRQRKEGKQRRRLIGMAVKQDQCRTAFGGRTILPAVAFFFSIFLFSSKIHMFSTL